MVATKTKRTTKSTKATTSKNGPATKQKRTPTKRVSITADGSVTNLKIQPLNWGKLTFKIKGISPLVVCNFSEKIRQQLLEKQMGQGKAGKKDPRCPVEEFLGAFYVLGDTKLPQPKIDKNTKIKTYDPKVVARWLKKTKFVVPASGFKNALISACRNTDLVMTQMKQTIFVHGVPHHDWVIIESKLPPVMDSRICRLKNGDPIERFRPMWEEWSMRLTVEYDRNMLTGDQIANLLSIAGHCVGWGEGRPQKSSLGWGRWQIA